MNRITATLAKLKESGRKALATYIVNGDPNPELSLPAMHAMVAAGADILELGVPFSDPMAEGPAIQKGHERALASNVSLADTLALVKQFRETNSETPVLLMGYANPIERMGYEHFSETAKGAGIDGVLTVDLPPEELGEFSQHLKARDLVNIFLVAPTTADARIAEITAQASGFIYYVSLKGVTGAGHLDVDSVVERVAVIKANTDIPVLVGFGIKDGSTAKAVALVSEGAVVGSALVNLMGEGGSNESILSAVTEKVAEIRSGLDSIS